MSSKGEVAALEPLERAMAYARSVLNDANHSSELTPDIKPYVESAAIGLIILSQGGMPEADYKGK